MRKEVFLVLGFVFMISLFSLFVFADDEVCCNYPGPADEPLYEWRSSEAECQSPENAIFGDRIVEDYFCEDDFDGDLQACVDDCKALNSGEEARGQCIKGCKEKRGFDDDFEHDPNYRCEDMNEIDCENAKDCEGVFGPSFCEGDVCTMDMAWKGCRFKGDEFFEEYEDEELKQDAGTTPGDNFYFIDKFFDKFGNQLDVKEERIAEIKAMVEAGDLENAEIALEEYMKLAEEVEHEIEPERKEEAKRSAAAIRATMKDIRDQLPPEERGKFVSEVMSKEHSIATAAEISSKIKDLCVQLAELDPVEYSIMCKTDDDAPKWQKKLDKELTAEQEETAKEFVNVMKQCFETSGQDCACEEIPFYDFSVACSKAAPLATACSVDDDEIACDELENLDMPELPEWLEPIWKDLEKDMKESQYEMHMPPECVEEGVTNPKECGKVMIKTHAPLECKAALLESDCDSEIECREICDEIMFELHTPQECIDEGLNDPDECAEFMDNFRSDDFFDPNFKKEGFGRDCKMIEDPMERLDCYDNKENEFEGYYGPMDGEVEGEITWQCKEHRIHWPPDCEKFMREELPEIERQRLEEGNMRREQEGDWRIKEKECASSCDLENGWWDFRDGECVCYATEGTGPKPGEYGSDDYEGEDFYVPNYDCNELECGEGYHCDNDDGCVANEYAEGEGPGEPGDFDNNGEPPSSEGEEEPVDEPEDSGDDSGEGDSEITGNAFLDYYWS